MSEAKTTQANRTLAIAVPDPYDDKIFILAIHGSEALGRLFQFELDLFSEGSPVDPVKIIGQNVTIRLDLISGEERYFNGLLSRFILTGVNQLKDGRKVYTYRATLVPWTWFLTRTADCRMFQDKTVPEIIEKVFRDKELTDFDKQLTRTYRKWEYCVQYRETDFNFISRLMENEGIYYYFKHENGKHTMILCDAPTAHKPAPKCDKLRFTDASLAGPDDACVWEWTYGLEITSTQAALTDYDPLQPKASLFKAVNVDHSHDPVTYEVFDYPGGFTTADDSKFYAKTRIEEVEAGYILGYGRSSARSLFAGCTFTLTDHPVCPEEEYLITAITYQIRNDEMGAGFKRAGSGSAHYECLLTALPNKYVHRPGRITPKPVVQGPQTAVVVGKSGDEICVDKYGRIKVRFFWDRDAKGDETSSCWIRVAQNWAGKQYGIIFHPRVGQEVIVDFLEGDPDRPIVTGRVYNAENMPPYTLPANATQSTIKTNSSKGGGGFNEIRFEDKKGSEQIFIHGENNMDVRIKNDRYETVVHDQHLTVNNKLFNQVDADQHEKIGGSSYEAITGDHHVDIQGMEAKHISGSKSLKVDGDVAEVFGASHSETTSAKISLKATDVVIDASSITFKAAGNSIAIGSGGISISVQGDLKISVSGSTKIEAATTFNAKGLIAKMEGTVTATVTGAKAKLNGDGTATVSGGSTSIKGDTVSVEADGPTMVKGAIVKIN